jgi:hypothetical protein
MPALLWLANCYFPIPQDSSFCCDSLMRNLAVLFIHFIAVQARLLGPGGVRSLVAESILLKHQILILNRSRKRSPNLHASDRILGGVTCASLSRGHIRVIIRMSTRIFAARSLGQ